jgi:hypothetical protein
MMSLDQCKFLLETDLFEFQQAAVDNRSLKSRIKTNLKGN